ncbi:putative S-adenosyl-L-methionine-dependent methyltransferase [Polystyrenella longa]|uniref:Putative S-adenosyl-L-methionine-dependent methyltransferase n=1 Tax=Polystyrenella longa TaxID=2528007 RepID=A0A518CKK9_9PLAN|nr:class I SAM-dependent methyltransferase [Polystyrenella longa]QDU79758.1 putative S-adenosyl-L-methionine-dependent methyltransferase [Polystyrenella longa]
MATDFRNETRNRRHEVTESVQKQYELLPYPDRDPERELESLRYVNLDQLAAINHKCFRGQLDLSKPRRVLVAGGGTGDSTVFLAEQLRHFPAEVVHVDLSERAMNIARRRIEKRGLTDKVTWRQGSLLDLAPGNAGFFDYINCVGVLHHLDDPSAGLAALNSVLKPDGAMGLMVYGRYGRTAIYQMQRLLTLAGLQGATPSPELFAEFRRFLNKLPATNWQQHGKTIMTFIKEADDSELYDLFFHTCDQAYSVTELVKLLNTSGLHLLDFTNESRFFYQSRHIFRDSPWWSEISNKPVAEQQEMAEIYWGCVIKHAFWAAREPDRQVNTTQLNLTPGWSELSRMVNVRNSIVAHQAPVWSIDFQIRGGIKVTVNVDMSPVVRAFCELIDDQLSTGEIIQQIKQSASLCAGLAESDITPMIQKAVRSLTDHDLLFLRHPDTVSIRS